MPRLKLLAFLCIAAFWVVMNGALVRREIEYGDLDEYRQGIVNYLGQDLRRERWMGVYRDHRKIGYTGFVFSKTFEDTGIRHTVEIDSLIMVDLFGAGGAVRVRGTIVSDHVMIPLELDLTVGVEGAGLVLRGERRDDAFVVRGTAGALTLFEQPFPLRELYPTDGFFPSPPISGFEVGQSYDMPLFDPVMQQAAQATVDVVEHTRVRFNGLDVDCFVLETHFRGMKYRTWMTPDGDTIKQEIPPPMGLTLKQETRYGAPKGIVGPRRDETGGARVPSPEEDRAEDE